MADLDKAIGQLEADIKHADRIGALFVYIGRKQAKDVLDLLKEQKARKKNRLPYSPDSNVQWTT